MGEQEAGRKIAPIGVFDSGVGGLTVLREMQRILPAEDFVYIGDTIHAPYGNRSQAEITRLSLGLTRYLLHQKQVRGVVVACNTATAASAEILRQTFPGTPIVAMEPAVKPAARATRTGKVGILATVGTLSSARFAALLDRFGGDGVQFLTQPCPGLVEAIEAGQADAPETRLLLVGYIAPLLAQNVDTLVLGCTHYPLLRPLIAEIAGPNVVLIDTGEAVARRVKEVLGGSESTTNEGVGANGLELYTTGDVPAFARAAGAILCGPIPPVRRLIWNGDVIDNDTH